MLHASGIGSPPVRIPTVPQLRAYMKHTGWSSQPPGAGGAIWIKEEAKIGIPAISKSDPVIARGVLERLAAHERVSLAALAPKVRYHRMDVTLLRAANDQRITDTIPFEAAATVIGSARKLLRAAGTTAWHERGDIGGNYARRGDEVLKKARMDHTQEGSFIIPLLVPLSDPPAGPEGQMPLPDMELYTAAPEPFERRVTRTFAQSIMAVKEIIVDPEGTPTIGDLHTVVERGVSREFCSALAQILAEPAIGEFETTFDWADALPGPATMPESISIDGDAHRKIEDAAALLKRNRIDAGSTFSGNIIELRRLTKDPFGYVTISTVRRGRLSDIRVRLPFAQYQDAVSWHQAQRAVIVEGEVSVGVGRRLVVDHPVKCRPIDEFQPTLA
ncbi:hypothetical protein DR950_25790 [Kitasatospora xanthocidica]|uniref:Uncharacterized protein n=1 Tax=Kitasatospora xanthocidica TaxID=83382 RepID=A0A372ZZC6_9ACTN|nr:hypothetical protein [Kitasatospora xanthocidica]RGD60730.1 hypothetical protein DR950_25790 [Kitasatospora xanthocidica]